MSETEDAGKVTVVWNDWGCFWEFADTEVQRAYNAHKRRLMDNAASAHPQSAVTLTLPGKGAPPPAQVWLDPRETALDRAIDRIEGMGACRMSADTLFQAGFDYAQSCADPNAMDPDALAEAERSRIISKLQSMKHPPTSSMARIEANLIDRIICAISEPEIAAVACEGMGRVAK